MYNKIPEEVLGIEVKCFEELEPKTLAFIIQESTDEDIIYARYTVASTDKGLDLSSFIAYTDTKVLNLIFTPLGHYMLIKPRRYGIIYGEVETAGKEPPNESTKEDKETDY